jgi:hypothetical protein
MKYDYHFVYDAIFCPRCGRKFVLKNRTWLGPAPGTQRVDLLKIRCRPVCGPGAFQVNVNAATVRRNQNRTEQKRRGAGTRR